MTLMVRFPRRSAELTPKPSKKVAEELSLLVKVIFFKSFFLRLLYEWYLLKSDSKYSDLTREHMFW